MEAQQASVILGIGRVGKGLIRHEKQVLGLVLGIGQDHSDARLASLFASGIVKSDFRRREKENAGWFFEGDTPRARMRIKTNDSHRNRVQSACGKYKTQLWLWPLLALAIFRHELQRRSLPLRDHGASDLHRGFLSGHDTATLRLALGILYDRPACRGRCGLGGGLLARLGRGFFIAAHSFAVELHRAIVKRVPVGFAAIVARARTAHGLGCSSGGL
jgi:hypothetical protein